jgi:predicted NBD/HSP70 family sugar kinase
LQTGLTRQAAPPRASLDTVLRYAWEAGVFVSDDAMAATGLTRTTTIDAVDELIGVGLLRELPNARAAGEYRKGRPSRRFELRADAAVVVGVDAGRGHLNTTVADLAGTTLASENRRLDVAHDSPDERRAVIMAAVDAVLAASGHARENVLAVCAGVPAPVDVLGRSPRHRDDFWRRMNPDLHELLAEWVPIVRIENDASLAAVAEGRVGSAVGLRDYVVLLAGDRFGAGVVVDGSLLRGRHGGIGEMVAFDHVTGVESADGLGTQLTTWARQAAAAGELPARHPLAELPADQLTGLAVLELSRAGDEFARTLVERGGRLLSRIAAVVGSLYDPERIIVAGAIAESMDEVIGMARVHLPDQIDLPAPELVLSSLGSASVVTGAVAAAIEAAKSGVLHLGARGPHVLRAGQAPLSWPRASR